MNLRSKFLLTLVGATLTHASTQAAGPVRNTFLAADKYAITHFDPAQSDVIPYPVKRGVFRADVASLPRLNIGPVNIMTFASTDKNHMWGVSSQGVTYIDVSNNGFRPVATLAAPGIKAVSSETLTKALNTPLNKLSDVENIVKNVLKGDMSLIIAGVYAVVDKDNRVYYNTFDKHIHVFGLKDKNDPSKGIEVIASKDLSTLLAPHEIMVGTSMTYDGKLIITSNQHLIALDRSLKGDPIVFNTNPDESITNSVSMDEKNAIYVASDKNMRKIVWKGTRFSTDEKDGAWIAGYDFGREPNSVKIGFGTGSTPTLMGFGADQDKLVVITDGADHMKLVAFWRDAIPKNFKQLAGTKSPRIAGQIAVTCGLDPMPEFVQSEQSVVIKGYGAFVVNNIRKQGAKDRLIDVLAGGPVFEPPRGAERFEWNPQTHAWRSVWTKADLVSTSMVPAVSDPSNIVMVNGYTKKDGWEITGMDWNTGETVHRTIFGQSTYGNGAYAIIQTLPNGDLLFNSIGGPTRVPSKPESMTQAQAD